MTIKELYGQGVETLTAAGMEEAKLDAWYLLEHITGITRTSYYINPGTEVSESDIMQYEDYIVRRSQHIPLQHMTGVQEFMGLEFLVNRHVLIPRQDTELLVEESLSLLRDNMQILDMCTGSGCIIISLCHYAKKKGIEVKGLGVDISAQALDVAKENAKRLGVETGFVKSDLFETVNVAYEMIVSNPPYIKTADIKSLQEEVQKHDPYLALDGKEDGLYFYRRIIEEGRNYLKKNGCLLFETGYDQSQAVKGLMEEAGFSQVTVKKDLAGLDRVVFGVYDSER